MMSLWDALRMNMMISYQELVRTFPNAISLEVNISALAIAEAKGKIKNNEVDVVLLGPQVRFQKPEIEAVAQGKMPVAVIEMKDYGTMNGQAVLEFAMKLLQE